MSDIVPITPDTDLSDLRLERTANGHVVSPFFTYDYEKYHRGPVYEIGSHFHSIRFRSIAAFAQTLGIGPEEVVVFRNQRPSEWVVEMAAWDAASVRTSEAATHTGRADAKDRETDRRC